MKEIYFEKYKNRGANYHWEQVSKSIRRRNPYVVARYENIVELLGPQIKDMKVLDIGCGDEVLSYMLYKKRCKGNNRYRLFR